MTPTRILLNYWLDQCYAEDVVRGHPGGSASKALANQLQANQALAADAQTRTTEITDAVAQQDFISKKHREYLTAALAAN